MPQRNTIGTDALVAAAVALLAHLLLLAWLWQQRHVPPPAAPPAALQVVWIEPPPPPVAAAPPPVAAPTSPAVRMRVPRPPTLQAEFIETAPAPATAAAPSLQEQSLQERAAEWARTAAAPIEFARRSSELAALPSQPDAFRMRPSLAPADVVKAIGTLFGGADYAEGPCPRIRRNLAGLASAGERALAEEEIRRLRRDCL